MGTASNNDRKEMVFVIADALCDCHRCTKGRSRAYPGDFIGKALKATKKKKVATVEA